MPLLCLALLLAAALPGCLGRVVKAGAAEANSPLRLPDSALGSTGLPPLALPDTQPPAGPILPEDGRPEMMTRVINGSIDAQHERFPYAALIRWERSCTGSLIRPNVVLTAAHCLVYNEITVQPESLRVRIQDKWHDVSAVHPHPDYNSTLDINHAPKSQPFNDIALIILAEPSDAPTVQLPEAGGRRQPEAGDVLWAAGYGLTEEGRVSDELRYIKQAVFAGKCEFGVFDTICAGFQRKTTCDGDSGGPLVDASSDPHVLEGLLSFGDEKCKTLEAYYTSIRQHLQWIRTTLDRKKARVRRGRGLRGPPGF